MCDQSFPPPLVCDLLVCDWSFPHPLCVISPFHPRLCVIGPSHPQPCVWSLEESDHTQVRHPPRGRQAWAAPPGRLGQENIFEKFWNKKFKFFAVFIFAGKVLKFFEKSFDCTENLTGRFLKYSAQRIVQKKVPASFLKSTGKIFSKNNFIFAGNFKSDKKSLEALMGYKGLQNIFELWHFPPRDLKKFPAKTKNRIF